MKKLGAVLLVMLSAFAVKAQTNVVFYTSMGNFMIEIREDLVPITGNNFLDLVNDKFYDGVIFHRVIDNFMIQGGDPTGTGAGGPGYSIVDEFHDDLSNVQMSISMANSGPNTGGSQFFINLVDNIYLDYDEAPLASAHPVFGMVTEGFEIVQDIGGVATSGANRPINDVVIDSIRVTDDYVAAGISDEVLVSNDLKVYPNPIEANSTVQINSANAAMGEISIYDTFGKLISQTSVSLVKGLNEFPVAPLTEAINAAGIYYLRVTMEGSSQIVRIQTN